MGSDLLQPRAFFRVVTRAYLYVEKTQHTPYQGVTTRHEQRVTKPGLRIDITVSKIQQRIRCHEHHDRKDAIQHVRYLFLGRVLVKQFVFVFFLQHHQRFSIFFFFFSLALVRVVVFYVAFHRFGSEILVVVVFRIKFIEENRFFFHVRRRVFFVFEILVLNLLFFEILEGKIRLDLAQ